MQRDEPIQTPKKKKGQSQKVDNKPDKPDSVFIAQELIAGEKWEKRLGELRQIKTISLDKFSEKIHSNLVKAGLGLMRSQEIFMGINSAANQQNTTGHQMASILTGFAAYWAQCQPGLQDLKHLFALCPRVYVHIAKKFIKQCGQLIRKSDIESTDYFAEEALKMVRALLKSGNIQEQRILALVGEFELYGDVPLQKIVDLCILPNNQSEIYYIFKTVEGEPRMGLVRLFVDRCVGGGRKQDLKKCEGLIRHLNLDPFEFPHMISRMKERYIAYQIRTYRLFQIEYSICHDRELLSELVRECEKVGQWNQARYFELKYGLSEEESMGERERVLSTWANVLETADCFGPTETMVLKDEPAGAYLHIHEFGYGLEDITFVDGSNIEEIEWSKILVGGTRVGIDSETCGGTHVFDPQVISVFQVCTQQHIYIFDYRQLQYHALFHEILVLMFKNCIIYGQGHQKEVSSIHTELKLPIEEKQMQELARQRLPDTIKLFKKAFPKDTKSSLAHICNTLTGRQVSKYEQCSGWRCRPLRQAQMHYAALDAVLPLRLGQRMEMMIASEAAKAKKK